MGSRKTLVRNSGQWHKPPHEGIAESRLVLNLVWIDAWTRCWGCIITIYLGLPDRPTGVSSVLIYFLTIGSMHMY